MIHSDFEDNPELTCDSYVAEKPNKRCRKEQPGTDKKLKFFCPATCRRKCKRTDSPTASPTINNDRKRQQQYYDEYDIRDVERKS